MAFTIEGNAVTVLAIFRALIIYTDTTLMNSKTTLTSRPYKVVNLYLLYR